MPRLKSVPGRLPEARTLLQDMTARHGSERERHQHRDATQPWRAWYKTARWQRLRSKIIKRDKWMCQQTGVLVIAKHPAPTSPVVDHITPHRGDPALFWDEANLQTVAKAWHDTEKQRQEAATR